LNNGAETRWLPLLMWHIDDLSSEIHMEEGLCLSKGARGRCLTSWRNPHIANVFCQFPIWAFTKSVRQCEGTSRHFGSCNGSTIFNPIHIELREVLDW
jgi:hypothetical protein